MAPVFSLGTKEPNLLFVLPDFAQCLCNQAHWRKCIFVYVLGQLCVSVSVPRGVLVREYHGGQWEDSWGATGSTFAFPNPLKIGWTNWGWSLHSP